MDSPKRELLENISYEWQSLDLRFLKPVTNL